MRSWSRTISTILVALACAAALEPTTQPEIRAFLPVTGEAGRYLHNAHIVTSRVISGAQPENEAAFNSLRELGVNTIISVDGARPNNVLAQNYGMRYIHLPIGYDDVPLDRAEAIAKAIVNLAGPVYIHCHHGKHRSAAAVAVACVMSGELKPEQAESVLTTFGTGANYTGLWKAARDAQPVDPAQLKALDVQYVEYTKIGELAESMVAVDHRFDNLKLSQKIGWQVPKDHPDIDPPHEALQLQEHFYELSRLDDVRQRPDDFRKWLADSNVASKTLHEALKAAPPHVEAANAAFNRVQESCTACHKVYRD